MQLFNTAKQEHSDDLFYLLTLATGIGDFRMLAISKQSDLNLEHLQEAVHFYIQAFSLLEQLNKKGSLAFVEKIELESLADFLKDGIAKAQQFVHEELELSRKEYQTLKEQRKTFLIKLGQDNLSPEELSNTTEETILRKGKQAFHRLGELNKYRHLRQEWLKINTDQPYPLIRQLDKFAAEENICVPTSWKSQRYQVCSLEMRTLDKLDKTFRHVVNLGSARAA